MYVFGEGEAPVFAADAMGYEARVWAQKGDDGLLYGLMVAANKSASDALPVGGEGGE